MFDTTMMTLHGVLGGDDKEMQVFSHT